MKRTWKGLIVHMRLDAFEPIEEALCCGGMPNGAYLFMLAAKIWANGDVRVKCIHTKEEFAIGAWSLCVIVFQDSEEDRSYKLGQYGWI